MSIDVPAEDINAWLDELKPYQSSTLKEFLKTEEPEQAAQRWLGSTGSPNIVSFGGERDTQPFWDRFKDEFRKFVCDDKAYAEEKEDLTKQGPASKSVLISTVSATIGATIGYSATLLAPAVVMLLFVVGKMGRNAYCAPAGLQITRPGVP